MDIIDIRTGTVIISIPFRVCFRHSQFAIHSVHLKADVQLVPVRQTEQVIGKEIQITVVSISGAYISGLAAGPVSYTQLDVYKRQGRD